MEPVDILLYGGMVLTMNADFDIFPDGAVAIQGDHIVAVGDSATLQKSYQAVQSVDCTGQLIMPGLVNAHTHVPMTLLRGMADDLRLEVWLMGYVMPTENRFVDENFCRLGTLLAAAEMIRGGVTLFNDMYYHEAVIAQAAADAGMRAVCGQTILKFPSPDNPSWEDALAYTEQFIQDFKDHPLIVPAVAPHAPYTCTDEILRACADLARRYDVPLHIHIAETRFEVDRSLQEEGTSVLRRAEQVSVLDTKCICAHCVHLDAGEIKIAAQKNVGISHNPSSNLKLSSGLAPVAQMLREGCKVGIGTDGAASNNDLDMLTELHLASLLAKVETSDPTALPARQALLMATRLGAAALHLDHLTGSLEAGKRADLLVMDDNGLHMTPRFTHDLNAVYGRVVYAAKSTDVQHVMCNGVWLMRQRELLTLDEAKIRAEAQALANEIDAFVRNLAQDNLNKLIAIGGVEQRESYELQAKARFANRAHLDAFLQQDDIEILHERIYHQYDHYFVFADERIRYREDTIKDTSGTLLEVRTRLTYTAPKREREFGGAVLLSRSRFMAPAAYPLRFYREYFNAPTETEIEKTRTRWRILYKGIEFYVNFDELRDGQTYIEIKARTWSRQDAESKAALLVQMITEGLAIPSEAVLKAEYVEMALAAHNAAEK